MTTQYVSSGVTSSGLTVSLGNEVDVRNGGQVQSAVITSGGRVIVSSGGTAQADTVSSGGLLVVSSGGTTGSDGVLSGGLEIVSSGGFAGSFVGSGGTVEVSAGGSAVEALGSGTVLVDRGGEFSIGSYVTGETVVISSGGLGHSLALGRVFTFPTGRNTTSSIPQGDDQLFVSAGGVASNVSLYYRDVASNAGIVSGASVNDAYMEVESGGALIGATVLTADGTSGLSQVTVLSGGSASNTTLSSGGQMLVSSGGTVVNDGAIAIGGVAVNTTVTIEGVVQLLSTDQASGTAVTDATAVPCFVRGTRILTAGGEVAVEALRVGDLVVTFLGRGEALKPVRWLGQRRVSLARHPRVGQFAPVRIRAGALAEGRPSRDLLVSPGHRFPLDGVLVAAIDLVNGATIVQETPEAVEYWHVELDGHDVLLADGVEAESYQDTGNRDGFDATNVVSLHPHPGAALPLDGDVPEPCLPYGTAGEALRGRLRARAEALGWTLSEDPAPWLEVAGARIEPVRRGERLRFTLPAGHAEARLRSRSVRPRDVDPGEGDARRLGLSLHRLVLVTPSGPREVALDHPRLREGFSYVEREDGWCWRWTDGDALLPLAALVPARTVTAVEISVDGGLAFWVPPAAADAAADEQPVPDGASGRQAEQA